MRELIMELQARARSLEPDGAQRAEWTAQASDHAESFLDALPRLPVYVRDDGRAFAAGISEQPATMESLLGVLAEDVERVGINPASGGHLGYIPGGGIFPAALGDFLADVANRYSGVVFASPGAAQMEMELVRWMADLVGYPAGAAGDLTSGGSIANLSAVAAAREARGVKSADVTRCTVYLTRQVHHCIDKALRLAGLGEVQLRYVPMDGAWRMRPAELDAMVRADLSNGRRPFLVVASAGSTDTGAVDPLVDISAISRTHGLWLHVDAAYGGFFMLCEEGREALQGLDLADSIVLDPHKGLFLPYGSGALLVREGRWLAQAHAYQANYMQDANAGRQVPSPAALSPELSRPFRGLRLWLPLRLFGLAPFRAALAEKIRLARYFHARLASQPGWEVGPSPDLSVVTYRYLPASGAADAFNRDLLQAVHDDGRVFITSTQLEGRFTLRLAVLHYRTHLAEVDYLLELLTGMAMERDPGRYQSSPSQ